MSIYNTVQENNDYYQGLDINSTEAEKLNAAINFLVDKSSYILEYDKLFIPDNKRIGFDQKLRNTGFVKEDSPININECYFSLSNEGKVMLAEHGSYLDYIALKDAQDEEIYKRLEERDNLEMQKLRGEVALLTNKLVDYDKFKSRSKLAVIIAAVAAFGTIIQAIVSALKK